MSFSTASPGLSLNILSVLHTLLFSLSCHVFLLLLEEISRFANCLNSASTSTLVHTAFTSLHFFIPLQTYFKLVPISRCERRSNQPCWPARQYISKLFLQALDWHCWKDIFHVCQSLWGENAFNMLLGFTWVSLGCCCQVQMRLEHVAFFVLLLLHFSFYPALLHISYFSYFCPVM